MSHLTDDLYRLAADYVNPIKQGFLEAIRKTLVNAPESAVYSALGKDPLFAKALDSVEDLADILGNNMAETVLPKMTDAWFAAGRKVSSVIPKKALLQPYIFDTSRVATLSSNSGYRSTFIQQITEVLFWVLAGRHWQDSCAKS